MMDDFNVFLKNDKNFFLKQLHFIISLINFIFLILINTIDSVIVALAIPGSVLNSAFLLGLYCVNERHDATDIEILMSYGLLNLLATMIFVNKILQMDISIFRMLFLNSYTINTLLCLCSGFFMLAEGTHSLIIMLVRNIYNSRKNRQNFNEFFHLNNSTNISKLHKEIASPEVNNATNTSPSLFNFQSMPTNVLTYAEKDTNTNPYEDILIGRNSLLSLPMHSGKISNVVKESTTCFNYKLNSEHDKHRNSNSNNSGNNDVIPGDRCTEKNRRRTEETPFTNKSHVQNYFHPKTHTRAFVRHSENLNKSGFNEDGLPVFVDRYGKRYIASLTGGMPGHNHLCSANVASHEYDTSIGDCKKKTSTPIDEYYTNRKYSNSKVTITPSKDEINTNELSDSKAVQDSNVVTTNTDNSTNQNTNNIRVAINEHIMHNRTKNENIVADSNDFITNYSNYLAHLYKNNNSNNVNKSFNYKFYDHNYDYQWVCEA